MQHSLACRRMYRNALVITTTCSDTEKKHMTSSTWMIIALAFVIVTSSISCFKAYQLPLIIDIQEEITLALYLFIIVKNNY